MTCLALLECELAASVEEKNAYSTAHDAPNNTCQHARSLWDLQHWHESLHLICKGPCYIRKLEVDTMLSTLDTFSVSMKLSRVPKKISIKTGCIFDPHERISGLLVLDWEGCKSPQMHCNVLYSATYASSYVTGDEHACIYQCPPSLTLAMACRSLAGFQSGSHSTSLFAPMMLRPTPPALLDNSSTKLGCCSNTQV